MKQHTYQRSRFSQVISFDELQRLDSQVIASQVNPYPLTINAYFAGASGANLLTKLILWKLRYDGHYCYRNNNTGIPRKLRDGKIKWTPGSKFASGAGDIFATIDGRACFFEVKVGKDRISASQEQFKAGIEQSGGFYAICHTFDEFLAHYHSVYNSKSIQNEKARTN